MSEQDLAGDELASLKQKADLLGISYHPSIGAEKLREKIRAVMAEEGAAADAAATKPASSEVDEAAERQRLIDEASKLIRIRVVCMNPAKKDWEGDIFTVGNSIVGTFKKFVPFNNDEGWHVPNIIYQHLIQRECQVFVNVRDERGNTHRKGKLIKEFAIEVLPPLTEEELAELARRQAMAAGVTV